MNWDLLKGEWTETKGKLRAEYGRLSDDELEETRGEKEQVLGLIQQQYGKTKEEIEREINSFLTEN